MSTAFTSDESGFAAFGLRSREVEIVIVPALGGRLLSLRDLRTGRQWLDRPLGPRLFHNPYADDFTRSTFAGADECLPTIGACRWQGRDLPDHGEAWTLPWTLDAEALAEGTLQTTVSLPVTPVDLTRRIHLDRDEVTLEYHLTNRGTEPEPFVWALHPLLTIAPGDLLELPADVKTLRVECASGVPDAEPGSLWHWPEPCQGVRLDRMDFRGADGFAKFFAGPLTTGYAALISPSSGCRLEFHWPAVENPWLGIWLTRGAFRGFHHVAIEPTNGDGDCLDAAASRPGGVPTLPPGDTSAWTLRLRLGLQS